MEEDIQPVLSTSGTFNDSGKREGSASLITTTPYKTLLEGAIEKNKKQKLIKKIKRKGKRKNKKNVLVPSSSKLGE